MRRTLAVLAALALTGWAAAAWACVPQPILSLQPLSSGPPGTQVKVMGLNFGSGTVELRWNGFEGERLQTVSGPEFATEVTIPAVPDGVYVLLGIPRAPDGTVVGTVPSAVFEVVGSGQPGATGRPAASAAASGARASSISTASAVVGGAGLLALGLGVGLAASRRKA